ncbi:MAG: LacI family transcriptional regulator [Propionibacteriaceae bacterium]|jgi:DNA-binding LacI/PurR family transcriptional regulator|nr:LacI family transcriptional regulator [Propionibacteriaceae bacterium]
MEIAHTPPTMADVAALAGVSHQTVSRVLNNHPSVSEKTRQKVNDSIATLGYRRNLAARALATGDTRIIGVLVSNTSLSGPSGALLAIEQAARSRGYWVAVAGLQSRDPSEAADAISHFIDFGADGIIAIAQTQAAADATLKASQGVPTLLVTSGVVPPGISTLDIDQAGGATQAMTILRGLGHTRIAHVSGPEGDLHAGVRESVWREMVPDTDPAHSLCIEGDWSAGSGYRATMQIMASGACPTAIFAANDRMAFGVLRALNERGLTVPHDMSVVGFDDFEGSDCAIPPLTTIRQDHEALSQAAMELLLEAIANQPARAIRIPATLVVRSSAGAVPRPR